MKKTKWKRMAAFVLTGLTVAFSGCSLLPKEEDVISPPLVEPETVTYTTQPVTRGSISSRLNSTGNFVSTTQYEVSFEERGGYLSEIYVSPGQYVEKGQILAELDVDSLKAQIVQQQYAVEKAQINYEATAEGKITDLMSDADRRILRLAEIDLELAQIQLEALKTELSKSTLYAPASGTVVYLNDREPGQYINARETLVRIADPTTLLLRHTGDDSNKFVLNADAEVTIGNDIYQGKVVVTPQTAPKDAESRNYVDVQVESLPEDVEIGDVATFAIILEAKEDVIVVPRTLVQSYSGDAYYVQVLEDAIKRERSVEVGIMTSTQVEIVSGLTEGEELIIR